MRLKAGISKIRSVMEHNSFLQMVIPAARRLGIVHFLHAMTEKVEQQRDNTKREEFQIFYEMHKQEFDRLAQLLEDDFSRLTLEKVLEYRKTRRLRTLKGIVVDRQYFQKSIFGPVENEVFIDGGAYVGDTIQRFTKNFQTGGVQKNLCMGA